MIRIGTLLVLGFALWSTRADAQLQSAGLPPALSIDLARSAEPEKPVMPSRSSVWTHAQAPDTARHKSPVLAWFLSWLVPGGGQGYNGQWTKAAAFFGAAAVGFALVASNDGFSCSSDCGTRDVGLGILIVASLGSQIDAPISASAINRKARTGVSARPAATLTLASMKF